MRERADPVEKLGVERAAEAARQAALVFAVLDGSRPLETEDETVLALAAQAEKAVVLLNKSDLGCVIDDGQLRGSGAAICHLSARTGEGLDRLCQTVEHLVAVSYTHLDVYKRQAYALSPAGSNDSMDIIPHFLPISSPNPTYTWGRLCIACTKDMGGSAK